MAGPFVQVVQTYPQIFRPKFDRVPVRPLVKASIDDRTQDGSAQNDRARDGSAGDANAGDGSAEEAPGSREA